MSQIIMIHKPSKPLNKVSSYHPISLTPVSSLVQIWFSEAQLNYRAVT